MRPLTAIRAECLACMGGSRGLVADCPSKKTCPLWAYRLGRRPETGRHRPLQAIKAHCRECIGTAQEVRTCTGQLVGGGMCKLHLYRLGHNPKLKGQRRGASKIPQMPVQHAFQPADSTISKETG